MKRIKAWMCSEKPMLLIALLGVGVILQSLPSFRFLGIVLISIVIFFAIIDAIFGLCNIFGNK